MVGPVGCGCELARAAATDPDPDARAVYADAAPTLQARWGCPHAEGCRPVVELDADCRAVLANVEALTGAGGFETCPLACTRWDWVHEVLDAHAWWDKGQLGLIEPHPSRALVDAISAIERGGRDRLAWEIAHPEKRPDGAPPGDGAPGDLDEVGAERVIDSPKR